MTDTSGAGSRPLIDDVADVIVARDGFGRATHALRTARYPESEDVLRVVASWLRRRHPQLRDLADEVERGRT